jgi:nucleotide-binding universal stress UspA family protein
MSGYTMVVGVDGSPGSAAAVAWCAEIAPMLDADVVAVHALGHEEAFPSEREFGQWCAQLHASGLFVRRVVEDDSAAQLLQRVATAEDADLVVIGATHHGELAGFVLGSVVEDLAYHGRRPIVIVPVAETADSG